MSATSDSPPPVLHGARVLAYAVVDSSVQYTERQTLYVDGKLLGGVLRLAICQNFGDAQLLGFHCDEEWNVLGVSGGHDSLADAKSHIERAYAGIGTKWIDTNVSVEEATAYRRENTPARGLFVLRPDVLRRGATLRGR